MDTLPILLWGFNVLLSSTVHGVHDAGILNLYKHWSTGDGTYYGKTNAGLCSLNIPNLPPVAAHVNKLVALNSPQMFGSSGCGMCFKVNGTGHGSGNDPITGTFVAYVKDICPECKAGALDLAENGDGRWTISIHAVQCPVGNTKIEYRLEGSNPYYLKLQVRNERATLCLSFRKEGLNSTEHTNGYTFKVSLSAECAFDSSRMPATTVEMYQPNAGIWVTLTRSPDGFWIFGNAQGVEKPIHLPFKVRLHAPNGKVLVDTVHVSDMGSVATIHGNGVQFPLDHHLPHA